MPLSVYGFVAMCKTSKFSWSSGVPLSVSFFAADLTVRKEKIMEQIRISAKDLGALAMPDFCERCFWIERHAKKLPWQRFPGIFSTIDSYTKKIVRGWIDRDNGHPEFLKTFGVTGYVEKVPHWSKFQIETKYGITLSGAADDIWTTKEGYVLPDYKTAKFTDNADKLLPMYRTQLNGYAKIAEATGLGPVKAIPLIYMEPQTADSYVSDGTMFSNFRMVFQPKVLPLDLDIESIDPLLERARKIYDGGIPDRNEDCKDCIALSDVILKTRHEI